MLHKSRLAIWKPQLGYLRLNLKREVTRTPKFNYFSLQSGVHSGNHLGSLMDPKHQGWTAGNPCQPSVSREPNAPLKPVQMMSFLQRTGVRFAVSWEKSCSHAGPEQHPLHLPRWGCPKPQVLLITCSISSSP